MIWNVLDLVLGLVLLMYFLPTVESEECNKTDIIVGRLGGELVLKFLLSKLREEFNKNSTERGEIQIQDLRKELQILKRHLKEVTIYKNGNPTGLAGNLTEIFMTNDTFVVKKTKLQKEDAGIYWIEFRAARLGQKALIITGKPTIIRQSPPNPVLKPEDNYISTIQLECHSVSTSIGDCPLSMYTVWYKNGMRMTDLDPTLSQINVTVDYNGGSFACLSTDYPPCYQRLQTTKYHNFLNIEECNNVFESETFILQPEYPPIDVKLEPDQREITVNANEYLKVRCSSKCHPQCDVTWGKDYKVLKSNGLIFINENMLGNDLVIENVNSSHEGVYVCLVNNTHGENKMDFTLSVTETEEKVVNSVDSDEVIVTLAVILAVLVVGVIIVVVYNKYQRHRYIYSIDAANNETMLDGIYERGTFTDYNFRSSDQDMTTESEV